ncbi:MAG: NUDIX hydrolase [Clostridiales bacterium]|nr:NUDIX hydrolase [Candidatus Cacconaster stercorequi]
MSIIDEIKAFIPGCEQEERDQVAMLRFLAAHDDAFDRENLTAHMTASAWVISPDKRHVVMCYHNLYQSWSWTGGHADGERDLAAAAIREVEEETGLRTHLLYPGIFSLENLTVEGHIKRGVYVPGHIHMNVTYLVQAESEQLRQKPDENSGVRWMTPEEALASSTEPWMVERVYRKLVKRAQPYMK